MDLFGPLKNLKVGKKHILCITDAFSKYVELDTIPYKTESTIALTLFSRWLCQHGLPLEIVSDREK
jgi:hypothetical protein